MYANEWQGKFPPRAYPRPGSFIPPVFLGLANIMVLSPTAIYPEYISDPGIYICPPDAVAPLPSQARDRVKFVFSVAGLSEGAQYDGLQCALGATSYAYLGWVALQDEANCCAAYPSDPCDIIRDAEMNVMATAGTWIANRLLPGATIDSDLSWPGTGATPKCWGSGDSATTYRVREGIERFFITDINNPAASSVAQSEIAVVFHYVSSTLNPNESYVIAKFNHIPGGMNCLFMDGHVEFLRYGTRFPASKGSAYYIGIRSGGDDLWETYWRPRYGGSMI